MKTIRIGSAEFKATKTAIHNLNRVIEQGADARWIAEHCLAGMIRSGELRPVKASK